MGKQFNKKITWTIKNFSSLHSERIYSDHFVVDACRWKFLAYPKGSNVDSLSLFLEVANYGSLPIGWRRHAKFSFSIVNQRFEKLSRHYEAQQWFEQKTPSWGWASTLPLKELHVEDSGFLVSEELKIVAEVDVLEVIGQLDVSEETSTIMETIHINGFQFLPSQAKIVQRMFERHPDIASKLRPKNSKLRTGYMSLLLSLIETMCQSPQEMSKDDLSDAYAALGSTRDVGFKLDWLEKKLDEVFEKKEYEEASETGMQEMEEELKEMKRKCLDIETLLKKEKEKVLASKTPLSLDDVF